MALFGRRSALQRSYDAVAAEFAQRNADSLEKRPADRRLLDQFATALRGAGPCVDLGCGPGFGTRYLKDRGVDILGIDISAAMLKQARTLHPEIRFEQGDMRTLDAPDHGWAAAVALHCLQHIPGPELQDALLEFRRVIEPGGALLIAFQTGLASEQRSDWWGYEVDLAFHQHRMMDMLVHMQQAGFREVSVYRRPPYPELEETAECAWILAEALPGVPPARRGSTLL